MPALCNALYAVKPSHINLLSDPLMRMKAWLAVMIG